MAAERKKSISVPQRSEERVMVFYWSVKLERERHWVRFGDLLGRGYGKSSLFSSDQSINFPSIIISGAGREPVIKSNISDLMATVFANSAPFFDQR